MTIRKTVVISCNHPACGNRWTGAALPMGGDRPPAARAVAAQQGWTRRAGYDFCPLHEADAREDHKP